MSRTRTSARGPWRGPLEGLVLVGLAAIAHESAAGWLARRDVLGGLLAGRDLGVVAAVALLAVTRVGLYFVAPAWMVLVASRAAIARLARFGLERRSSKAGPHGP